MGLGYRNDNLHHQEFVEVRPRAVLLQQTCPAAEGLLILTHSPFNPTPNIAFQNVLAPAQRETMDGFNHSYSDISCMFPAKITGARLYI